MPFNLSRITSDAPPACPATTPSTPRSILTRKKRLKRRTNPDLLRNPRRRRQPTNPDPSSLMLSDFHLCLKPGELIVHESRLHPVVFFGLSTLWTFGMGPFFRRASARFVVTDRRILLRNGDDGGKVIILSPEQIRAFFVYQSWLGRLLGYGTLMVSSTDGGQWVLNPVSRPELFRQRVCRLIGVWESPCSAETQVEFRQAPPAPP